MSVDLDIPGDPAAIRTLAEVLDPGIADRLDDLHLDLAYFASDSAVYWSGAAGDAFRDRAGDLRRRSADLSDWVRDAAEIFRAYAGRLERGRSLFDDLLLQADRAGLLVIGRQVLAPTTWLASCPATSAPKGHLDEWRRYLRAVEVYQRLGTEVGKWWGTLEAWLAEQMAPLKDRGEPFDALWSFLGDIQWEKLAAMTAAEYPGARATAQLRELQEEARNTQAAADRFTRQLRSGNPAVRAAAVAANPAMLRASAEILEYDVDAAAKGAKVMPIVGGAVNIVFAGVEIAMGASVSTVTAGTLGGFAGMALAGAVVAPALPVIGVVAAAGVLAFGGGAAASWAWEAWVPLDVREAIDAFFVSRPQVGISEASSRPALGGRL